MKPEPKLTPEKVAEYRERRAKGEKVTALAKEADVHVTSMYAALRGVSKNTKNPRYKGPAKVKRAKTRRGPRVPQVMSIPLVQETPKHSDRVVVMLVERKSLANVIGDLYANS